MTDDDVRLRLPEGPGVALDVARLKRRVERRRTGRRVVGGALGVLLLGGAVAVASLSGGGGTDDGEVPSPLFGEVEQLVLTSLPDGWARCGGGPSTRPDATERWWAQTFGPSAGGECTPLVTVIQVPPGDDVRIPDGATNGGIGEEPGRTGAKHWSDPDEGSRGLYTGGSGGLQQLVVEGCCGETATGDDLDLVASAARDATRERAPARCTEPHSDLDQESFLTNYFARLRRAVDDEGCPVRGDIVSWHTEPPDAHCFANITFLTIGDPLGAPFTEENGRLYTRNPAADLDADLPASAIDTGFHQGDSTLWIDEADDSRVYVVRDGQVEAWPRDLEQYACA